MLKGKQKIHKFAYIFKYLCKNVAKNSLVYCFGEGEMNGQGTGFGGRDFSLYTFLNFKPHTFSSYSILF